MYLQKIMPIDQLKLPQNWRKVYNNIKTMRKDETAPVDQFGADKCVDKRASKKDQRFQVLVSLIISSQTKDQITFEAMTRLLDHGLDAETISKISKKELKNLIYPVGFWKTKTKYLKNVSKILLDKYEGDIPDTIDELLELPGVGPKVANLAMTIAWDEVTGISVDSNVHRVVSRLGWVPASCKTPNKSQKVLEEWVPKKEVSHFLFHPSDIKLTQ